MKSVNVIYYLLFMLLILGAFAAMAQNSYGFDIIGFVGLAFGIVFLVRSIRLIRKGNRPNILATSEFICLSLIALVFALKALHVYLAFLDIILIAAGTILILIFAKRMVERFRHLRYKSAKLALIILVYHVSLILFILSLVLSTISPLFSAYATAFAFLLLLVFLCTAFFSKAFLIEGVSITAFNQVNQFRDSSVLLVCIFSLMALYTGLTRTNILPTMYSDDFPQAYFRLVNGTESRKEKAENGKFSHKEFKEQYEAFLKQNDLK